MTTIYDADWKNKTARRCGECSLCCRLLPIRPADGAQINETLNKMMDAGMIKPGEFKVTVEDFHKPAGQRCPHQKHHKGCTIYERRPFGCRFWNCRWLINADTADLARPD